MQFYTVADPLPEKLIKKFGPLVKRELVAIDAAEFRCPTKDEFYLDGKEYKVAYRAYSDLSTPYNIAKLVVINKVDHYEIVKCEDDEYVLTDRKILANQLTKLIANREFDPEAPLVEVIHRLNQPENKLPRQ